MPTPAIKGGKFPGVIGTFMGRDALALTAKILGLGSADTVLLPSYLCNEVVKPFLGRCRIEFYGLQPGLTIDPQLVRKRLAQSKVKAFVMINFFGFLDPLRHELKQICAENGTLLIEDCALSLLTENSGETGDLAVYSFRKTLPVPDGGGLKINSGIPVPQPSFRPQVVSNILSLCVMAKQRLKVRTEILSRSGLSAKPAIASSIAPTVKSPERFLPMSSFARRGIQRASYSDIIERQRRDFVFWSEQIAKSERCVPIYDRLAPGVCPLGFPVKIQDRNEVKRKLQERGVFLKVHWRMPSAIGQDFPESHALSAQMLTLPVYPELGPTDIEKIAEVLGLK